MGGSGVPYPKTAVVKVNWRSLAGLLDGTPLPPRKQAAIERQAEAIGYPLFMRTDMVSGKHSWEMSCFVPSPDVLKGHIGAVVDETFFCGLEPRAIVLRAFLELDSSFTAFWGKMPVSRERRYFVADGSVTCHHAYWPEDAIKYPSVRLWRQRLRLLNTETDEEVALLTQYAQQLRMPLGAWSVDFACTKDGKWYLIDMAPAEASWHPSHEAVPK